jgi:cell division protein FtsZ
MSDPKDIVIKVFGLGGGGSNAVNRMIDLGLEGVDFIAANTDAQALTLSLAPTQIQLGPRCTRGLGAGGKPEVGEAAADESRAEIRAALAGADLVFLTAGLGGGTGTGAISIAAQVAQEIGALTVAIVTTPFSFEASHRRRNADGGLARLRPHVDTLITVPNDKLLPLLGRNGRFEIALRVADEVLRQGVQGISELVGQAGLINVDFANVRTLLHRSGNAMMAMGQGHGEGKAMAAVQQALKMPLLDRPSLQDARGVLVHFTGGGDLGLIEVSQAAEHLSRVAPNAEVAFGATIDPVMAGRTQVILIVTGFSQTPTPQTAQPAGAATFPPVPAAPALATPPPAEPADLAEALFSRAVAAPALPSSMPVQEAWYPRESPAATDPNNLDVPAFLRRRRSLRDFQTP